MQARPRDLAEVGRLIEKLDGPTASQATIKVFPLQNGDATSIQRLLETLFGTRARQRAGSSRTQAQGAEGGTETSRADAAAALGRRSHEQHHRPGSARHAAGRRGGHHAARQQRRPPAARRRSSASRTTRPTTWPGRSPISSARSGSCSRSTPKLLSNVELLEREVFVVSEPISNSLLLSATPRYFDDLKKMIDKLDAPPAQVIIQALIVEVELDNTDEFGIELGFQSPVLFDRSNISNLHPVADHDHPQPDDDRLQQRPVELDGHPGLPVRRPIERHWVTNPHKGPRRSARRNSPTWDVGRIRPQRWASAAWCWRPAPSR